MEVRNLIAGSATVCGGELSLRDAARTMVEGGVGSLGVVDGGRLVGILTDRDVVRAMAGGSATDPVSDWMTPDPDFLAPDVEVEDAAEWLLATGYRHLPVVDDGRLVGMISIKDVLWALDAPPKPRGRT